MARQILSEPPQAFLHTLSTADGSATYTAPGNAHKIIAGVNYPVDVPYRNDEIPESTVIEINIRPHNGVTMVKERHVEGLVKRTLEPLVLGQESPRTMLQVTLQVVGVESDESLPGGVKEGGQGESYLAILASAINASVLGCIDAGVQLRSIAGAALVGVGADGQLFPHPNVGQRKMCTSLHVFAFTSDGKTILMESEGRFHMSEWTSASEAARRAVLGQTSVDKSTNVNNVNNANGDVSMFGSDTNPGNSAISVTQIMRKSLEERVIKDERWRQD
ncbi:hypothetical protein B0A52_06105 [Exophiala mesophila]|uniref:Exoribonuclease phosphorolytic domain-containing protein n=1 Tax=Exophiala mesophila TaxID=212818 RepID=A0A438N5D4_EXOME|nr:hypothetical protein B0A52_06105 [Exophiala mesophila]